MKRYRVRPGGPLKGTVSVPGDKSIGHRTLLFGALAEGISTVRGLSQGLDNEATANALRAMGVKLDFQAHANGLRDVRMEGVGLHGLKMPKTSLDCGNSGTTMRLLAGILSAQHFGVRLLGDASLTKRPMRRIVEPLRARGAHIAGLKGAKEGEHYAPLSIAPLVEGEKLTGLRYDSPVASAQVKSAILLSGLYADGPTIVYEPTVSRDHTERMMLALGVPLESSGSIAALDPSKWSGSWKGFDWEVPGDLSSAAFLIAAALVVPGSELRIRNVGTNPTRTGFIDALRLARIPLTLIAKGDLAGHEPISDIFVESTSLFSMRVGGELLTRMIDEVPILTVLAACARGRTEIRDADELRAKESDRIQAMHRTLTAFGADAIELQDGLTIHGGAPLRAATVDSEGDHRIAMSAVVLGLIANGETIVNDVGCVETSYPGFAQTLRTLGANVVEEEA